jgi:hypothetical protein
VSLRRRPAWATHQQDNILTNAATVLARLAMLIWLSSVAIVARRERTFSAPLIAGMIHA